jgi:hypothetical protein
MARPLQRLVRLSRSSLILRGLWGQLYACIAWDLFKRNHLSIAICGFSLKR